MKERFYVADDVKPEVFRGSFNECVHHFRRWFAKKAKKGSRKATAMKKPIADFCGVIVETITRWVNQGGVNSALPVGGALIKLVCFLDLNGYRISEWERLDIVLRGFAELVGYSLLTPEEAAKLLDYSTISTMYNVLQGTAGIQDSRKNKMWSTWTEKKEALDRKKEEVRGKYLLGIPTVVHHEEDEGPAKEATSSAVVEGHHKEPKKESREEKVSSNRAVIHLMEALLELLEVSELPPLGVNDRRTIEDLTKKLNVLSSKLEVSNGKEGADER